MTTHGTPNQPPEQRKQARPANGPTACEAPVRLRPGWTRHCGTRYAAAQCPAVATHISDETGSEREARLAWAAHVHRAVEAAPPLTAQQREGAAAVLGQRRPR